MFLIPSEEALVAAFRPRDQKALELPPVARYPVVARDYYAWVEPGGTRTFLVVQEPATKRLMGISFRRASAGERDVGAMCDWCHCFSASHEIGLLTAERSSRKRVGVIVCRDLRCRDRLEEAADLAGRTAVKARQRVVEKMLRFAREALGIEEVPEDVGAGAA